VNPAVTLAFRYLPGEYVRAVRAHRLQNLRLVLDSIVSVVFLFAGTATLLFGAERDFWLGVAFCGLGLALPALIAVALMVVPRIALARSEKLREPYRLTFSDQGIRFETTSIESNLAWSLYTRVTEVRDFYLLYWGRREFTVIPKRAFETAADMQAFDALLVAHVAKIERRA
jgi:YcxB-like protein